MSNPTGPAPAHRSVASIRPGPSVTAPAPNSPHTPLRNSASTFGSPSALRAEEDCVILEIGARYLRAGFAGDAVPKVVLGFGREEQRRAGDYRQWDVENAASQKGYTAQESWGERQELWRSDLRGLDLGLVGDKIERAVREAYTKYLLIDSRPRRALLALPPGLPLPLVSIILDTLFSNFQPPSISLMSNPVLTTVAAGSRTALVVDIGWAETVVTAVYEYREVQTQRSVRGTKLLGDAFFELTVDALGATKSATDQEKSIRRAGSHALPSFEEYEDIMERMMWCKPGSKPEATERSRELTPVVEEDELRASMRSMHVDPDNSSTSTISIPLTTTKPARTLELPFEDLSRPCEKAFFGAGTNLRELDDEESPLHLLIYHSLLRLPVDIRSLCMSRIIFVGGGSNIPGLKARILNDVSNLLVERGWDPVQGRAYDELRGNPRKPRTRYNNPGPITVPQLSDDHGSPSPPPIAAAFVDPISDPITDQLQREARKRSHHAESGKLRVIQSLGAWSGGSLLSQLKISAVSVVDREQWLQHGSAGATRIGESGAGSRQSAGPSGFKAATTERSSWTLGLWG